MVNSNHASNRIRAFLNRRFTKCKKLSILKGWGRGADGKLKTFLLFTFFGYPKKLFLGPHSPPPPIRNPGSPCLMSREQNHVYHKNYAKKILFVSNSLYNSKSTYSYQHRSINCPHNQKQLYVKTCIYRKTL